MPTAKRERKREGQRARQEAIRAEQRRAARRRGLVTTAVLVALGVLLIPLVSRMLGGNDKKQPKRDEPVVNRKEPVKLSGVAPGAKVTGETPCPPADGSAPRTTAFEKPPPMCIDVAKTYTAEMKTNKGTMTITFDAAKAPKTVNNFVVLGQYHYFDGIPFHRIIPGFVVQGGDPEATGTGGPGYKFEDELPQAGQYEAGSLAMANSGPNTNGSQFFIITGPQGVGLPPSYSLFGKVTEGLDVAKKLEAAGTPGEGKPRELVKIESVTISES